MPHTAAGLVAVTLERPTCSECLAMKAGVGVIKAGIALSEVRGRLRIVQREDRCRACGAKALTVSVERPA